MSGINIEQFIVGAENIDRMRAVITRVINCLVSKIEPHKLRIMEGSLNPNNTDSVIIAAIELGQYSFSIQVYDQCLPPTRTRQYSDLRVLVGGYSGKVGVEKISWEKVPHVYRQLCDLVQQADRAVPEAGIAEFFKAMANMA